MFLTVLNEVGSGVGITFTGEVGVSVDFLDVTVTLTRDGSFNTKLYTKPTDASRYLNRRSDHGLHTFSSIPYSQFRRSIVLCSNIEDRDISIKYISKKLQDSGYKEEEIQNAKMKALELDREKILNQSTSQKPDKKEDKQLIFTINHDHHIRKKIKEILQENQEDINELLGGETRLIVAERRNTNIASALFAKSAFSSEERTMYDNQKCGTNCVSCRVMNIAKNVTLWKGHPNECVVNLDYRCNCLSDNIVYLFICKLCPKNRSFYVGQSINTCKKRTSGHKGNFNLNYYKKSALSVHMFKDHPESFDNKLRNYELGIIKSASPLDLDRCEDYYLEYTKAHLSLNRYKVTQK